MDYHEASLKDGMDLGWFGGIHHFYGQTPIMITKWYQYSTNIVGISDLEPWLTSLATELVGRLREEIFEATSVGAGWDAFQSKVYPENWWLFEVRKLEGRGIFWRKWCNKKFWSEQTSATVPHSSATIAGSDTPTAQSGLIPPRPSRLGPVGCFAGDASCAWFFLEFSSAPKQHLLMTMTIDWDSPW